MRELLWKQLSQSKVEAHRVLLWAHLVPHLVLDWFDEFEGLFGFRVDLVKTPFGELDVHVEGCDVFPSEDEKDNPYYRADVRVALADKVLTLAHADCWDTRGQAFLMAFFSAKEGYFDTCLAKDRFGKAFSHAFGVDSLTSLRAMGEALELDRTLSSPHADPAPLRRI